jgi:hypothetical protein
MMPSLSKKIHWSIAKRMLHKKTEMSLIGVRCKEDNYRGYYEYVLTEWVESLRPQNF